MARSKHPLVRNQGASAITEVTHTANLERSHSATFWGIRGKFSMLKGIRWSCGQGDDSGGEDSCA